MTSSFFADESHSCALESFSRSLRRYCRRRWRSGSSAINSRHLSKAKEVDGDRVSNFEIQRHVHKMPGTTHTIIVENPEFLFNDAYKMIAAFRKELRLDALAYRIDETRASDLVIFSSILHGFLH